MCLKNIEPIPVIFNNFVLCLLDTSERWTKDELECAFDKNNVKKIISKRRLKNSKMSAWLLRYENSILLLIRTKQWWTEPDRTYRIYRTGSVSGSVRSGSVFSSNTKPDFSNEMCP